mgnify:CR=1 FL=1
MNREGFRSGAGTRDRRVAEEPAIATTAPSFVSQVSPGCREWLLKRGVAIAVGRATVLLWPQDCATSSSFRNLSNIRTRITRVPPGVHARTYVCVHAQLEPALLRSCLHRVAITIFRGLRPATALISSSFSFFFSLLQFTENPDESSQGEIHGFLRAQPLRPEQIQASIIYFWNRGGHVQTWILCWRTLEFSH